MPKGVPEMPKGVPEMPKGVPEMPKGVPEMPKGVPEKVMQFPCVVSMRCSNKYKDKGTQLPKMNLGASAALNPKRLNLGWLLPESGTEGGQL